MSEQAEKVNPGTQSPGWDVPTKRIIAIFGFLFILAALVILRGVLPLVAAAVLLAYILFPLTTAIENVVFRGRSRGLAVVVTFVILLSSLIAGIIYVIPAIFGQAQSAAAEFPRFAADAVDYVDTFLNEPLTFRGEPITIPPNGENVILSEVFGANTPAEDDLLTSVDPILNALENLDPVAITQTSLNSFTNLSGQAFSFVGGAVRLGLNLIFLLTMVFYLLKDGDKFVEAIVRVAPSGYQADTRRLLRELGFVWNSYLRGQIILSLIMGGAMFIMATVLGLPNAIILGVIAGILEFIPNIGPALAMVPPAAIALFSTSTTLPFLSGIGFALVVIAIWTVMQQTEGVVLIPRIVGQSLNLHPFVVIVAVIAGASLGGILGVLIAAPVVASIRLIAQYVYGKLIDREPFPAERRVPAGARRRVPLLVRFGAMLTRWVRGRISNRPVTNQKL